MNKPKLLIHKNVGGTLGMDHIFPALIESDLFEVGYHDEFLNTTRGVRGTIVYFENKKVYIDFWEYPTPTFTNAVYKEKFDLIIALQCNNVTLSRAQRYLKRKRMMNLEDSEMKEYLSKIVPWTFFPSRMFVPYIGREQDLFCNDIERVGFFCGKSWKVRGKISKSLQGQGIEIIHSSQERRRGRPLNDKQFIRYMQTSKYGIVLGGRASAVTDQKNRREADYMMMKKPLLINYHPFYYNQLENGKHFILIDEETDLNSLEERYNINEIAENGHQWYLNNLTPTGVANVFRQIMKEKLNI